MTFKYKETINSLLKSGSIKECPIDYKVINSLIRRSTTDIETSKRNLEIDNDCSYNYAYNAILHAGLALMESRGFRPEIKEKHVTIVKFVNVIMGNNFTELINNYDFMRRKRHIFIYEPNFPCSKFESEQAIDTAIKLVNATKKNIKEYNPQLSFDF